MPEIEPTTIFLTLAEIPSPTGPVGRHEAKKSLRIFVGIFLGALLVVGTGYAGIALKRHAAIRTQERQRQRTLSELQAHIHGLLTIAADEPSTTPEMRADYLASRAKVDALFAVDARMGTNEASIFIRQENDRRERLGHAPARARLDPQRLLTLDEERVSLDSRWGEMIDDLRNTPEMRADELAGREKVDALFALDARLGTNEVGIFLQQEADRAQRVLDAMKAANAAKR